MRGTKLKNDATAVKSLAGHPLQELAGTHRTIKHTAKEMPKHLKAQDVKVTDARKMADVRA